MKRPRRMRASCRAKIDMIDANEHIITLTLIINIGRRIPDIADYVTLPIACLIRFDKERL